MITCLKVWWVHLQSGVNVTDATYMRDGKPCYARFPTHVAESAVKLFLQSVRG